MNCYQKLIVPILALTLLVGCGRGLAPSILGEVSRETEQLHTAERQVSKSQADLDGAIVQLPDLFRGVSEVAAWKTSLNRAQADLQAGETDRRELAKVLERNRPDPRISSLLADIRSKREAALEGASPIDTALAKWLDYHRDPSAFAARVSRERDAVRSFDLTAVTQAVHKAETDWPAKKNVLETHLSALAPTVKAETTTAETTPSVLIAEDDALAKEANTLRDGSQKLKSECGQLYDSWDKILTDLDRSDIAGAPLYRERLKIVRTHFVDVPAHQTETRSDEHWTGVSEGAYHAVENDIGMAVAHKDAGLFDSEAQTTPQPPGFSYVASPSIGSNQYGYWTHSGGESIWTFLPQYLILRELLWNHDYHPVVASEYNAYHVAQSRGASYYGRATPGAAPQYGTHGTFTQTHYADSRYVQSGGFRGSAYASSGKGSSGSSFLNRLRQTPEAGSAAPSYGGKRFGRQPGSEPLGQHFGHAPTSRPAGRSFGRRR